MLKTPRLIIWMIFSVCCLSSCIERFYPEVDAETSGLLAINAHLTDNPRRQFIEISRPVPMIYSKYEALPGCYVLLVREDGEGREFWQDGPESYYGADLDAEFLQTGMSYHLEVITPDGEEYHSDFDHIRPAPAIDTIYYQVERNATPQGDSLEGIRFFIDFTYDNEAYEYIRWELTETYEFHNPVMDAWIQVNRWRTYPIPDEERFYVCYISHDLTDIHSMSMEYLDQGIYIKKPFSFVPNIQHEQKLFYKYALEVKQLSIGPEAFFYWNELKKTSQEQGSLFDSQPAILQSNICNINDESERVLGFFSMAGVHTTRGIAEDLTELDRTPNKYYCLPVDRGPGVAEAVSYPSFFARATYDGITVYEMVNEHCVDCRAYKGSSEVKPDYW